MEQRKIAIILPCYNEEAAVAKVIQNFRKHLPESTIYVYDNNSTDKTVEIAKKNGAIVKFESRQGKGNVVKSMFANIDADIYVLCDGDNTYEAAAVNSMIQKLIDEDLDMVVGKRIEKSSQQKQDKQEIYRSGHRLGNRLFNFIVSLLFGKKFSDIFSGYRIFSQRFVKSFPVVASGFDIEASIAIHCLDLKLPIAEVDTEYTERLPGSQSKLRTYKDGFKILNRIFLLLKDYRPLFFFSIVALFLISIAVILMIPVLLTYFKIGIVPRFPTLFVSIALLLVAFISFVCGVILDTIAKLRREGKYLQYLSFCKKNI